MTNFIIDPEVPRPKLRTVLCTVGYAVAEDELPKQSESHLATKFALSAQ